MAESLSRVSIEKLKGTEDYITWKFMVRMLLIHEDLWEAVEEKRGPDDKTQRKALARICLLVQPAVLIHIRNAKTACEAWQNLENVYEGKGLTRRLGLLRTLFALKLDGFRDMHSYLNKISENGQQLHDIGAGLEDDFLAVIMLSGLSSHYDPLIMTLENSSEKLTTESVRSRLIQENQRRLDKEDHSSALAVSKPKTKILRCFRCKKTGHRFRDCMNRSQMDEKTNKSMFCAMSVNLGSDVWYVDSGAAHHMCNNLNIMHDYKSEQSIAIKVANGETIMSSGKGTVKIPLLRTISDVLYVPGLTVNLLSVSTLTKKGYRVIFKGNLCKVLDGDEMIAQATQYNGVFILDKPMLRHKHFSSSTYITTEQTVQPPQCRESQEVWHRRLGHLNRHSMDLLKGMSLGIDYDTSKFKSCVSCIQGKQTRLPFPKKSLSRAKELLGLIHTDLCGPMPQASFNGSRYFLTFIDDYSRKTHIYFLKSKEEVFDKFRNYKALVEKQTGKKVKVLRSDNGGEYINNNFQEFLKKCGIRHQTTVPHSPQQNGVAERANRTIVERARCMLLDAGVDQRFWAEAVNTAVYLKNRSPTKAVRDTVPEHKWSNKKVNLTHLRTFGCLAYALADKKKKFDAKCNKYIFVGYCDETKGYRLLDPTNPKVCIKARNVTFLENEFHSPVTQKPTETAEVLLQKNPFTHGQSDQSDRTVRLMIPYDDKGSPSNARSDGNITFRPRKKNLVNRQMCKITPTSVSSIETDDPLDETYIPGEASVDSSDSAESYYEVSLAMMSAYSASASCFEGEPKTVTEALQGKDSKRWRTAMSDEYKSFIVNNCWTLAKLPKSQRHDKCVFKRKKDSMEKF